MIFLLLAGSMLPAAGGETARTHGGYFTEERLAHARRNAATLPWARQLRDQAVLRAAPWVARADEELWAMVPGQQLGRCIDVTLDRTVAGPLRLGCLGCGDKIFRHGNYPYEPDFEGKPWKLTCPACGAVFPTNDFAAYYRSAIDEQGVFDPARGDRSLLFNTAHPDPGDPLHRFGVDDGFGYVDADGRSHRFIGYYAWKYWRRLCNGAHALAEAFVLTGDRVYARKAAVLLDRIADLYPSLDWKPYADRGWYHSDGGRGLGKIEGGIWETFVARGLAEDYDAILSGTVGDRELVEFLAGRARLHRLPGEKGSRDAFVRNVDEGLLRCVFDAVAAGRIRGNEGMHQLTVAVCAQALDSDPDTTRWLDWIFAPDGGAVPGLMFEQFDRDGFSDEGAPSYASMWGQKLAELAFRLGSYPRYRKHDLFRDYPQLRSALTAAQRAAVFGVALPNLGDSGATGAVTKPVANAAVIAHAYRLTGDAELAVAAWQANGNSAAGLGRDLYSADPDSLAREIERTALARTGPARPPGGDLLTGFGLALLEAGSPSEGVALAVNYGRTINHGHLDQLNFDLFAFGRWLAPDLGYPEFATSWPHRDDWSINTLSHNTVVVDGQPQTPGWGGRARLFERLPGLGVVQLEARDAYPQVSEYTRTLLLVEAPADVAGGARAYAVDIFRVAGGRDHLYSFHGPPGEIATEGLDLRAQPSGTYAGHDVPFAAPAQGFPRGYSYLYNVRRDHGPPGRFTVDWKVDPGYRGLAPADDARLRFHALSDCDDVALADGDPPQNKPGNPRRLGYLLLHRSGANLASTFVSVLEPYRGSPFLKSVRRLATGDADQIALEVEFVDGAVDRVLVNLVEGKVLRLPAAGLSLDGAIGHVRTFEGTPRRASLAHGRSLELGPGWPAVFSEGAFTGKVVDMNRRPQGGGWIRVDAALPEDGSLTGRQIFVATTGDRDACYIIRGVAREGSGSRLDCGPVAFVRRFAGPRMTLRGVSVAAGYAQGYEYEFAPGAAFAIPVSAQWNGPMSFRPDK